MFLAGQRTDLILCMPRVFLLYLGYLRLKNLLRYLRALVIVDDLLYRRRDVEYLPIASRGQFVTGVLGVGVVDTELIFGNEEENFAESAKNRRVTVLAGHAFLPPRFGVFVCGDDEVCGCHFTRSPLEFHSKGVSVKKAFKLRERE